MDEDDSQDELINRNTSQHKRTSAWVISDDSDDAEEESEEEESNSGEDDGEEEEEEEEEEANEDDDDDDEDDGVDTKAEDGSFGGTAADLAGMSSDEDADTCPICLNSFTSQPVATPENCEHYFCLDCILEWTKNANSCPIDRIAFNSILLRKSYGGNVKKMITIQKPVKSPEERVVDVDLEQTNCEVCGGSDREDRLLLCDGCDAGYHMECLTPPLDSVPVEEWFCPECEANNRHSSASEHNDAERLPSTARHAARRQQAAGTTRAIARTQQSERVRANVNRHRITQARTSQLAPTYLIQSTWLDETINAVIAGLNSSVYVRDLTPRAPQSRRGATRRPKRRRTSSSTGSKGKAASKGVKRKKRRRRTKSRRKLVLKKTATPRSRIANSLGIGKKNASLPTVYRPSEQTLSGMRADIGAASLSIYGDPCDLDPFVDHDEEEQQAHVTSLLEAKRRGISRSALRSHQPVARPVTASLSRRGVNVPQPGAVVEAAPVPDLLGSILSGQSMLMMDSSDVVINRDGSLKATKPIMPAAVAPGCSKSSVLSDACPLTSPATSPDQVESYSPVQPPQDQPRLQPACPVRPTHLPSHRGANGLPCPFPSAHPPQNSGSKSDRRPSADLPRKKPTKPMWEGVSVLPKIPKLKRGSSDVRNGEGSGASSSRSHNYVSERGLDSHAGDKGRQRSVDQRKGRAEGGARRSRPDTAGPSPTFSSSFSSSSAGFAANQPHHSASSSSSSTVSFRINASGNSWHSRRLSVGPPSGGGGGSRQEVWKEKKDKARKKQLRRDKQMLLASRTLGTKGEDGDSIYDPFNPTQSDSSSSEDEAESPRLGSSSQNTAPDRRASLESDVKDETQELEISEESSRTSLQGIVSMEVRCLKVEKVSRLADGETEEQTSCDHKVKAETAEEASPPPPRLKNDPHAPTKKTEKAKARNESGSKSASRASSQKASSKERHASGSETERGGRLDLSSLDPAIREQEKKRDRTHSSGHSGVRKRRSARSSSQSSLSSSPDRAHRRRSRSRSKDRRLSRSSSSSGSRERSQRKKQKHRSREGPEGRGRESEKRRAAKDNRRGRSRSKSPPELRSRSRSRDCKRRMPSKSRSRSRERRKDKTRPQQSASTSRHKGAPETKLNRRLRSRSRSRSRERRKEEAPAKSSQKASGLCLPSSKDVKQVQAKKKEELAPNLLKEDDGASVSAQEAPSKDLSTNSQARAPAAARERDIKKEKEAAFDMFGESAGTKAATRGESHICGLVVLKNEKGFKTEACEISIIKSEPSSPEVCPSATSVSPLIKAEGLPDEPDRLQPAPPASASQPDAAGVKQEAQQPSDSDDDFNVDVMLDSLQHERPENAEERGSDQQGKEDAAEGGGVPLSLATKAKNQVKRVTWNIQEPKGPQPEKSPSKLALYKLKLKQEGVRRPSATGPNPSQDGLGGVGDLSRRSHAATLSGFSRSDGALSQKLSSTEQGKEEDLSRKDKYLKKLHMQERAVEEVKLAIKPFYQGRDINKDEYKEILRKAVQKVCHSKSGEINPVKVGNLVRAYVDKYKHARKHKKGEDTGKMQDVLTEALKPFGSP